MYKSVLAISVGAALGALLRWFFSQSFNMLFPTIPPGTLLANWLGSYLIGVAMAFFISFPHLSPEWRLFVVTGFLGGVTTFSSFSAEITSLLQAQKVSWALLAVLLHVVGSVLMTFLGVLSVYAVQYFRA